MNVVVPIKRTDSIEFLVPPELGPSAIRALGMVPKWDKIVDDAPVPKYNLFIKLLRFYRKVRPSVIGNRCVFEPSCSRYSELVFRNYGFVKATKLTIGRLLRCKSGHGGLDLPECKGGKDD